MPTAKIASLKSVKMDSIIRAAVSEFAEHSFADASYNRIISKASLGKGTMYYYFHSKQDLFLTILGGAVTELKGRFSQMKDPLLADEGGFWSAISDYVGQLFSFAYNQPHVFRLISTQLLPEKKGDHPAHDIIEELEEWLAGLVLHGQELGLLRQDMATSFAVGLVWMTLRVALGWVGEPESSEAAASEGAQLVMDLLQRQLGRLEDASQWILD